MKEKITDIFMKCIIALAGLILLGLSLYALRYSYLFPVEYLEIATPQKDSVWKTVVGAAALFFLLLLVSYGIRQVNYRKQKLLQALPALMFVLAAFLFIQDGTVYQAGSDPWYICDSAAKFIEGDYSPLQAGGYLDQYPYQLGLTLYTELVFRLTGVWNVKALVFANLLAMTAGLVFGQLFLKKLHAIRQSSSFSVCYLLYLPIYLYLPFLYGEALAICFTFAFLWQLASFLDDRKKLRMLWLAAFACLMVICRANAMIVLIAVAIVLLLMMIRKWDKWLLAAILVTFAAVFAGRGLVTWQYELRAGEKVSDGIPVSAWIAMGMMEDIRGNGWYNGYGPELYAECGYDAEAVDREAKAYMAERIRKFGKDPKACLAFYKGKALSQWNEPTAESLLVLRASVDTEQISNGKYQLMFGNRYQPYLSYMNSYQFLLYLLAFLGCIRLLTGKAGKKGMLEQYLFCVLALLLIGGFLFQLLWEAKSRYIYYYMVLLLPLATLGISFVMEQQAVWRDKLKHK